MSLAGASSVSPRLAAASLAASPLFDVVVVGGGPAGLGAALGLARAQRRVLLVDGVAREARNARAAHMHNVSGFDGTSPTEYRDTVRRQIEAYECVTFRQAWRVDRLLRRDEAQGDEAAAFPHAAHLRVDMQPIEEGEGKAEGGGEVQSSTALQSVFARKLILATSVRDLPPEPRIPGYDEAWGRLIHFCPYCHGYEVRTRPWAVLLRSNAGERAASPELHLPAFPPAMFLHYLATLRSFNTRLTLFTHGQEARTLFSEQQLEHFRTRGIDVHEGLIERIDSGRDEQGEEEIVLHVRASGSKSESESSGDAPSKATALRFGQLFHRGSFVQGELVRSLLPHLKLHPAFGTIEVDMFGHTSVPHVLACGDCTDIRAGVSIAAASGSAAAAGANGDLAALDFGAPH